MSTVLWLNYLRDGAVESEKEDLWALYRFAPKLDALCRDAGVRPLSEFHDTTDLEVNLAPEKYDEDVDTWVLMAERGKWHPPEEGLAAVDGLLTRLRERPARFGLLSNRAADVIAELESCRAGLARASTRGEPFHLSVVG